MFTNDQRVDSLIEIQLMNGEMCLSGIYGRDEKSTHWKVSQSQFRRSEKFGNSKWADSYWWAEFTEKSQNSHHYSLGIIQSGPSVHTAPARSGSDLGADAGHVRQIIARSCFGNICGCPRRSWHLWLRIKSLCWSQIVVRRKSVREMMTMKNICPDAYSVKLHNYIFQLWITNESLHLRVSFNLILYYQTSTNFIPCSLLFKKQKLHFFPSPVPRQKDMLLIRKL